MRSLALFSLLLCSGSVAVADLPLIREFSGIGGTSTATFFARSPWLVEWHSRPPTTIDRDPSHLEVHLYAVDGNRHAGRIVRHNGPGRGEMLIEQSGQFRFVVQGQATEWRLRVYQLDDAYAQRLKDARREDEPRRPRR